MRKVNSTMSTLYNFSSQGAFPETPVGFYIPGHEKQIKNIQKSFQDNNQYKSAKDIFELAKNCLFLDRMNWISEIVRSESCPKCNYEKSGFLTPEMHPSYIDFLPEFSYQDHHRRDYLAVQQIKEMIENFEGEVPLGRKVKVVVIVDHSQYSYTNMASMFADLHVEEPAQESQTTNVVREPQESDLSPTEFMQLRCLFDNNFEQDKII